MKRIYIIDVARTDGMRGALIAELARTEGLEALCLGPRDPSPTDAYVGVLGHHPDIKAAAWPQAANVPVVHYAGAMIPPLTDADHYRFPWTLDRMGPLPADLTMRLRAVLVWFRDRGGTPSFLTSAPVPDALLAYHLLSILTDDPEAQRERDALRSRAVLEAKDIAAVLGMDDTKKLQNVDDANERRGVMRECR